MNPLAEELNSVLESSPVFSLLSDLGRRLYFPRGIVTQSEEAGQKAARFNATVGMAFKNSRPLCLSSIQREFPGFSPGEIFPYAPTCGLPRLRELWKGELIRKNPLLKGVPVSLPAVTAGLTHGVSLAADLFLDPGDQVLLPDLYWGNYRLIFEERTRSRLVTFPFYSSAGGFNLEGMEQGLRKLPVKKTVLLLNFPNNPTGYSPSIGEMEAIAGILSRLAREGRKILVLTDDAYFGLFYEKETCRQSPFAYLAGLHENILAVKLDGATKEEFTWGFRVGFLTYGSRGLTGDTYGALLKKTAGALRSSVSSCSRPAQTMICKSLEDAEHDREKKELEEILAARYRKVKEIFSLPRENAVLVPLPFNSGYFLTLGVRGKSAEKLRQKLLEEYAVGVIALGEDYIRVAYSSVDLENLNELFRVLDEAAEKL